jgi:hypothetical protein
LKLALLYGLAKLKFIHAFLPEQLRDQLPEPHTIPMRTGQFYLFTERVIHGSIDNKSDQSRWGVNGRIATTSTRIYTPKMLNGLHHSKYFKLKNINLDKWHAILIRGEDRYGYNRYAVKSKMISEQLPLLGSK